MIFSKLFKTLSQDLLPYVRTQAMSLIFQLLDGKPEQEQNLLRLLVNKLVRPLERLKLLLASHGVSCIYRETQRKMSLPKLLISCYKSSNTIQG